MAEGDAQQRPTVCWLIHGPAHPGSTRTRPPTRRVPDCGLKITTATVQTLLDANKSLRSALAKAPTQGSLSSQRTQTARPCNLHARDPPGIQNVRASTSLLREPPGLFKRGVFLEVFSGCSNLSDAVSKAGLQTLQPVDIKHGPHHDLFRRSTN